jgi:hypothetical protein
VKISPSIETDKEQNQNPFHHPVVPRFEISARPPVDMIENLFNPEQIQKFDSPQKPSKRAKPPRNGFLLFIHPSVQDRGNHKQRCRCIHALSGKEESK